MSEQKLTYTAGMVNTPLTKPAKLFFIVKDISKVQDTKMVYESNGIEYNMISRKHGTVFHFISLNEIQPDKIKMIWRNYKTLLPKFQSNWKYLFLEVDTKDPLVRDSVLSIYIKRHLPVYFHETLHGYHFFCIKPITKPEFKLALEEFRQYNPKYPPLTLRIKANKHVNEICMFKRGTIISESVHRDTEYLKIWIETQNISKLEQYYYVVNYEI